MHTSRFLSTITPPPPGFEYADVTKRDLLAAPIVIYTQSLSDIDHRVVAFAERVQGVVITPNVHFERRRLGPLLWHICMPDMLLPLIQDLSLSQLEVIEEAVQYRENNIELARTLERLRYDLDVTHSDYIRVTGRLQNQVREMEKRVRLRTAELESVNKELEAYSYSVSHDLRAPVRHLIGFSDILNSSQRAALDDEGKELLDDILRAGKHMEQLIEDLLMLSRVGRCAMLFSPVDLSVIAQEVAGELRRAQPQRSVEWNISPTMPALADGVLLKIAFTNLLANAWKYTGKTSNARIEVGYTHREIHTVYYVKDNGAGFDMAYSNKLFVPFQRLHSEADFEGTGVGLATVQRVIKRHGGHVWGEGGVGQGATFYFTLPQGALAHG